MTVETTLVRLNKYMAEHGIASRRRCDELIAEGKVTVDGRTTTELGTKVDPTRQTVEIDGCVLKPEDVKRRYYLLNKPAGVVCTNETREARPRAIDLVTAKDKGRIYTVGRLDEDTVGLVILTSDGELAHKVMHPRFGVSKTYMVKVHGRIDDQSLQRIRQGVHLSDGRTGGARVIVQKRGPKLSTLVVTLHEGRNREVRRMFAKLGWKVASLRRTRIGNLSDRGLKVGHWRPLTRAEVRELEELADAPAGTVPAQPRRKRRTAGPHGPHGSHGTKGPKRPGGAERRGTHGHGARSKTGSRAGGGRGASHGSHRSRGPGAAGSRPARGATGIRRRRP